ncbi:MAG TPA: CHAP domain-containing protein [Candidatus Dormibacteraeota bacterium]|nr:CHAP domain-containing protein [Candidatus Dormibacteraeota bacterium]
MPRRPTLTVACGLLASLVMALAPATAGVAGSPSPSASPSPSPAASSGGTLGTQRAQLVQQLTAATGGRDSARRQLLAAQDALTAVERRLGDSRVRLAALNARLQALARQIASDEQSMASARAQLGALVRVAYESSDRDGFAGAVLSASDFGQAMDRIRTAQSITEQVASLQGRVAGKEKALLDEHAQLQEEGAQASAEEGRLDEDAGRLMALVAARDQAVAAFSGPARELAARIAAIDDQLAPPLPARGPVAATGTCGNRFAFGYCTWYVATRRCIPWLGNAWDWWRAAAAYGYAEGQTPARGAVVVWGRSASSPIGHVAYVEAVGPSGSIPAGSFEVSEMNYRAWDVVDYRVVRTGSPGILGFIYAKAG